MAVAGQQPFLFNATRGENLLIARPRAGEEEMVAAARMAGIHADRQPCKGYDTEAGEGGVKLSGGQVRRLAIARAIPKDSPVLLLDEPTEGVDAAHVRPLLERVIGYAEGRRLLVITHSRIGLESMDEVVLMDEANRRTGQPRPTARQPPLPGHVCAGSG